MEQRAASSELWSDPAEAQKVMKNLNDLKDQLEVWSKIERRLEDAEVLLDLAYEEDSASDFHEAASQIRALENQLNHLELELLLSGSYDQEDAIIAIHAREGGIDAQDWASMLVRMYLRWAQRRGWQAELVSSIEGEEAGYKSATIEIKGKYAYGYAKAEAGQHRLVRLSPFDQAHRRHTSFVLVEVLPDVEETPEVQIREEDLKIDTYRASSAGGQHVNKTSSAVRITHIPTGIVVTCQNERSQFQNKETALKILRARLLELELRRQAEEQARLKGEHIATGWGSQIRSYVLHPYTMVKDHRTGYEVSDVESVLDGEIDPFIEAYLSQTLAAGDSARV